MGNLLGKDGIFSILSRKGDPKTDPNLIPELVNIDPYSSRLDLKGRGIEYIPETITTLKKLKWLNMPHNKLKELPDYLCQLSGLMTLRVLGNNISSLPPSFGRLSNLTCLDLGKNEFTQIQPLIGELQQLQELHLHWNKLSSLPDEIGRLSKLRTLNLYINNIKTLPDLSLLTNMTQLDLGQNKMTELPLTISLLSSLTILNLSGNYLEEIPSEVLAPLVKLRTFDVRCNLLKSLPPVISSLTSLRILWCRKNSLTQIPSSVYQLSQLRELLLAENKLKVVDSGIGAMKELNYLHLYANSITRLDTEIGQLVKLREFDISSNKLTELPTSMSQLALLLNFSVAKNRLTTIPSELAKGMASLQEFNLSENRIKSVPEQITCLTQLRKLNLNANRLVTFPNTHSMTLLQWLELSHNRLSEVPRFAYSLVYLSLFANNLKELPSSIGELRFLQKLDISYNRIKQLPPEFSRLTSLQELHMRGNQLETIPEPLFQLDQLRELSLSYNFIAEVPPSIKRWSHLECLLLSVNHLRALSGAIGELRSLKELDLSHNELRSLPPQIVQLTSLTDLDISGNQIEYFPPDFENLTELQQLKISFNRLRTLPVFTRSHRRPWISCTGNPYLAVLYYLDDADDDVKFILKLNKNTYKHDKLERKRLKKAEKLRMKALKKDGFWDKHNHSINEKSPSSVYFEQLAPDDGAPLDDDEDDELYDGSVGVSTNTVNTANANNTNAASHTNSASSPSHKDRDSPPGVQLSLPDSEPSTPHEANVNALMTSTPLESAKKHEKEVKTVVESAPGTAPSRRLRHSIDLANAASTGSIHSNIELSSTKPPKSPKKIRDRIQKIREKYNLTALADVWDLHNYSDSSTRRFSGSMLRVSTETDEASTSPTLVTTNFSTATMTTTTTTSTTTVTATTTTTTTLTTVISAYHHPSSSNAPNITAAVPIPHATATTTVGEGGFYRSYLGWAEMRGRRPDMQDTLLILPYFLDHYLTDDETPSLIPQSMVLAMFDGHGGTSSAEYAARRLPKVLADNIERVLQDEHVTELTHVNSPDGGVPLDATTSTSSATTTPRGLTTAPTTSAPTASTTTTVATSATASNEHNSGAPPPLHVLPPPPPPLALPATTESNQTEETQTHNEEKETTAETTSTSAATGAETQTEMKDKGTETEDIKDRSVVTAAATSTSTSTSTVGTSTDSSAVTAVSSMSTTMSSSPNSPALDFSPFVRLDGHSNVTIPKRESEALNKILFLLDNSPDKSTPLISLSLSPSSSPSLSSRTPTAKQERERRHHKAEPSQSGEVRGLSEQSEKLRTNTPQEPRRHRQGRSLDLTHKTDGYFDLNIETVSGNTTPRRTTEKHKDKDKDKDKGTSSESRSRSMTRQKNRRRSKSLTRGEQPVAEPASDDKEKDRSERPGGPESPGSDTVNVKGTASDPQLLDLHSPSVVSNDEENIQRQLLDIFSAKLEKALLLTFTELHNSIAALNYHDGTAALVALVFGNRLIVANAGDQRAVLCRAGRPYQITRDHRPDVPEEKARIEHEGGFVSENKRVDGVLALSRALGDPELHPHVTHVPDIFHLELTPDDQFLIIACDGVWDFITNEQAVEIVGNEADAVRGAVKLRDYAHGLGSTDNISVIVYSLRSHHVRPPLHALHKALPNYAQVIAKRNTVKSASLIPPPPPPPPPPKDKKQKKLEKKEKKEREKEREKEKEVFVVPPPPPPPPPPPLKDTKKMKKAEKDKDKDKERDTHRRTPSDVNESSLPPPPPPLRKAKHDKGEKSSVLPGDNGNGSSLAAPSAVSASVTIPANSTVAAQRDVVWQRTPAKRNKSPERKSNKQPQAPTRPTNNSGNANTPPSGLHSSY
jgi:Leucine-rich repeat (LRR) protein/serine/threonine protein phosphatase PrpC